MATTSVKQLNGRITEIDYSEGEALALDGDYLVEFLEEWTGKQVYAVYGFSDEPITPSRMANVAIEIANGEVDAGLSSTYSEITGFLWVNDDGEIGGHDMVEIFWRHLGEYGCIIVSEEPIDLMELGE